MSQGLAAIAAMLAALVIAALGVAVFQPSRVPNDASLWRLVFADRGTIGFLRLATIALAMYAIASAAALIVDGRWLRGLGASGLQVDDAGKSDELVEEWKAKAFRAEQARDQAIAVAREVTRWLNQT